MNKSSYSGIKCTSKIHKQLTETQNNFQVLLFQSMRHLFWLKISQILTQNDRNYDKIHRRER